MFQSTIVGFDALGPDVAGIMLGSAAVFALAIALLLRRPRPEAPRFGEATSAAHTARTGASNVSS